MESKRIDLGRSHASEGAHRKDVFKRILDDVDAPETKSLLDLGSGPCIFPKIARDMGFAVTAVDARSERVPAELDGIHFVESDVNAFRWSRFNVVSILGLLYHLELEDQKDLLSKTARCSDLAIIDTQVHIEELMCTPEPERFSVQQNLAGGYSGVLFSEMNNPMASVGNEQSFWHTESSLEKLFSDTGFKRVYVVDPPYQSKHGARHFFICEP